MKVLTVLGTRPEIIRLGPLIELLDGLCDHVLVHTGQNSDPALSDVFFEELGVRAPDRYLGVEGPTFAARVAGVISSVGEVLAEERPDRLLVLGDTDSGLSALVAKRLGIHVFHMEAGNRCFDDRVPEEVNRRVIDHSSDVLMPYTERSRANLLAEGIDSASIFVTGNPIKEVMDRHAQAIDRSDVLERLGVEEGGYMVLTAHRQETVDIAGRLSSLVEGVTAIARELELPLVCSVHPRTRAKLESFGVRLGRGRSHGQPPARLPRLRQARAARPLHAHRQRDRAGGVLHPRRSRGDGAGHHRAARDRGVRQQHDRRDRAGGDPALRARGARRAAGLDAAARVHGRRGQSDRGANRARDGHRAPVAVLAPSVAGPAAGDSIVAPDERFGGAWGRPRSGGE